MIQGNVVTKSVSIKEVRYLLNSDAESQDIITSYDLGKVCLHGNINKWAKCKPVDLYGIEHEYGKDGMKDGRPWWYGKGNMEAIKLPKAERWSDVSTEWEYNRPLGGSDSPFRLGDFGDYYHDAACPMIVSAPILNDDKISMADRTYNYSFRNDEDDSGYSLSVADIMRMNNQLLDFYACTRILVKSKTLGNYEGIVANKQPISDAIRYNGDEIIFSLYVKNGVVGVRCIDDYGGGMDSGPVCKIDVDDTILVYNFLANVNNIEAYDNLNGEALDKYSAMTDKSSQCYKKLTVIRGSVTPPVPIAFSKNVSVSALSTLSGTWYYVDDEDSVYKVTQLWKVNSGSISSNAIKPNNYTWRASLSAQGSVVGNDGNTYYVHRTPSVDVLNSLIQYPSGVINLNITSHRVRLYRTLQDAYDHNDANSKDFEGIPKFDEIVYNNADADGTGTISHADLIITGYAYKDSEIRSLNFDNNVVSSNF